MTHQNELKKLRELNKIMLESLRFSYVILNSDYKTDRNLKMVLKIMDEAIKMVEEFHRRTK